MLGRSRSIRIKSTTPADLGVSGASLAPVTYGRTVRVYATINFHMTTGATAATVNDFPVPDHAESVVLVDSGATLTACMATGETDGTIWFSVIDEM